MKKIILAFGLSIGLASCSSIPSLPLKTNKEKSISLTNSQWILEDQTLTSTITLNIESQRVSGNASCNNYFGELSLGENNAFSVQNIGLTRKHCDKMAAETYFLNVLRKANRYTATEDELSLYNDQILLLKFKKK